MIDFVKMFQDFAIVVKDTCTKINRPDLIDPLVDGTKRLGIVVDRYVYPKGTIQFGETAFSFKENTGKAVIGVSRVNGSSKEVSVKYATVDGTAKAGVDYVAATGTLTWADGDTAVKNIEVKLIDNAVVDGSRTFTVKLSNVAGGAALGTAVATVTVLNEDVNTPPPPPPSAGDRKLVGGVKLAQEFARGGIAIDFASRKCWMVGHAQRNEVMEYDLPVGFESNGDDMSKWPALNPVKTIPGWWPAEEGYGNSLLWWDGTLWVAPRVFYDMHPATLTLYALDGRTRALTIPRQPFSGFVKRGPGQTPYLGCGGYESGQGTVSGPTLATWDGQELIKYEWPADPGANLENWNKRAPRFPDAFPENGNDHWVAWNPRTINGVLEGRWCSDKINAGGLVLPEGFCFWPTMGRGGLDYKYQSLCFAAPGDNIYFTKYVYKPKATGGYDLSFTKTDMTGQVVGHEIDAQGRIYLNVGDQWNSGLYKVDCTIKVYA